jgi:hypothetical protein
MSYDRRLAGSSDWPERSGAAPGDPRAPQRAPGTLTRGKIFANRPEMIASGFRGGPEVLAGPGSEMWMRGAADELDKISYTTAQVNGPRRKRRK